jgi:CheY-like chemotaxis protein
MSDPSSNLLIREGRTAEILLVEDNRGDAQLASMAFREARIENHLTIAATGEEALELLREPTRRPPDLVLLDLNLPKLSGRDVLVAIKEDRRLMHIPVIVLSASENEQDIARSYDLHATAYIVKPLTLAKFRDVVSTIEQFFFFLAVLPDATYASASSNAAWFDATDH